MKREHSSIIFFSKWDNTDKQINKGPPKKLINKQTKKTIQKGTAPKAPTILDTWLHRTTVPPT